jgi:hypothetical protein
MAGNIKARRETLYLFFASLLLATSCTSMPGDSQRAGSPGPEKIQHASSSIRRTGASMASTASSREPTAWPTRANGSGS